MSLIPAATRRLALTGVAASRERGCDSCRVIC